MTTPEESTPPPARRRSSLADEHPTWTAPAKPPQPDANSAPTPVAAPAPAPAPAQDTPVRRQRALPVPVAPAANEDETLKKKAADAIYAWAAAEHKATLRMQRMIEDLDIALGAGATPAELGGHIASACKRHEIDPGLLPDVVRTRLGLA